MQLEHCVYADWAEAYILSTSKLVTIFWKQSLRILLVLRA